MESVAHSVEINTEINRIGRTATVLEHYANTVERRELVDSDFGPILRRAADLLRKYCPEVNEYERQMKELRGML